MSDVDDALERPRADESALILQWFLVQPRRHERRPRRLRRLFAHTLLHCSQQAAACRYPSSSSQVASVVQLTKECLHHLR